VSPDPVYAGIVSFDLHSCIFQEPTPYFQGMSKLLFPMMKQIPTLSNLGARFEGHALQSTYIRSGRAYESIIVAQFSHVG
jgi:hypothetical protein